MKNLLLIFVALLSYGNVNGQSKTVPLYFNTALGDMKAYPGTDKLQATAAGLSSMSDDNGGTYRWDATSTVTDDGFKFIQATGVTTGRWVRVGNANTLKGSTTLSGALLTTTYTVSFNATLPFVPITVIYTPRTQSAAQPSWIPVGGITTTGFTISYQTVPVVGTNNMIIDWIAIKQ